MRIFVSYARVDMARVRDIVEILRSVGHDPWFEIHLLPGQDWQAELGNAVRSCDAFLYALTPESVASERCQWEFAEAVRVGKPVIPVLLQPKTPIPQAISHFQYVDFSDGFHHLEVARFTAWLYTAAVVPINETPSPAPVKSAGVPEQMMNHPTAARTLGQPFGWCDISAGKMTIEYSGNNHQEFAVHAYAIAKYPITNAQFQVFVDAEDGYCQPNWWDYSDAATVWRNNSPQPHDPASDGVANHPRVNVTWYEAIAFCRWLSERMKQSIMLPTEQQWQRAAQGDDGRSYPWGNEFDVNRCNTPASGIGQTTPVTHYPKGASPFKVRDMSGNVWEWCLTTWEGNINNLTGYDRRVQRGGAFSSKQLRARVAGRSSNLAPIWNFNLGFRVVCDIPVTD